jgi:uncharacterized protein
MFNILRGVNLYVGDEGPETSSKHLQLDELKLPQLEEQAEEFRPGGADLAYEVPLGLAKLEASFKLKGIDPHTLGHFGLGFGERRRYTGYAALYSEVDGAWKDAVAVMEGRIGMVEGDAWKKGELAGHDYKISSIWFYRLSIGGEEIYQIGVNPPVRVIRGVDHYAQVRNLLRIRG